MLFFLGKGLLGKTASTLFYGDLLNSLLGNPIGRLVDRLSGKTTTKEAKDNLNLNKKLLNMNDGRGVPTRSGAMRFLGDGSGKLDDAPDIVPTNQSVLNDIAKNQGLSIGSTVPPEIDSKKMMVDGFAGMVGIIEQINKNIEAIGNSLVESAAIEAANRKQLMEDLEEEISEKGKKRSRTRFERSVFNFVSTRKNNIQTVTGNVANDLSKALLTSLGLELAANLPEGENEDDILNQTEKSLEKYGFNKDDYELVPQPDGNFKLILKTDKEESNSNNIEENTENKLGFLKLPKSLSTDDLLEFLIDEPIFNQKVIQNRKNELSLNNNINSVDSLSPNVSVNNLVAQLPLDNFSGSTQIIDLRKAEEIVGGNDTAASSATSQLDTAIADLDPSRKLSVYESFVRSV
mgnify:CR=1 FL=1